MWREVYRDSRSNSLEQQKNQRGSMENKAFEDVDLQTGNDEAETSKAAEAAQELSQQADTNHVVEHAEAQIIEEHHGPYAGMGKEVLLKYSQTAKWRVARWICVFLLVAGWCTMLGMAIFIIIDTPKCLPWWQLSTIYQIYPRSFYDSNGDGVGDLQGIIAKADYISSLGVGAVLLNSIYKDGNKDYGYDVTDFQDVDEDLGTIKDFEELLTTMHDNDIKVILDFIPNHSSNEHPWFVKSSNDDKDYYTYYMWTDSNPNNWVSLYSGPAWDRDDQRQQHYLHQYSKYQPDLNYGDAMVEKMLTEALEAWFTLGVDGFNMHDMQYIHEIESLLDEPANTEFVPDPADDQLQYDSLLHYYTKDYEGRSKGNQHDLLRNWRKGIFDQFSSAGTYRLMLTDSNSNSTYAKTYYGTAKQPEADVPQNMNLLQLGDPLGKGVPSNGIMVKDLIDDWMQDLSDMKKWPNFVLGNHEVHRVASRLGPLYAKAANMLLLTLPGTPICYYGDEIGMEDIVMTETTVKDIRATNDLKRWEEKTRDPERSPMQWNGSMNAGFTTNETTWLPVNDNYASGVNVMAMMDVEGSMLHMFKGLVDLRKSDFAFQNADMHHVLSTQEVVSYVRQQPEGEGKRYLIAINFGTEVSVEDYYAHDMSLPIQGTVVSSTDFERQTEANERVELNKLTLAAGEGLVVLLDKADRPEL